MSRPFRVVALSMAVVILTVALGGMLPAPETYAAARPAISNQAVVNLDEPKEKVSGAEKLTELTKEIKKKLEGIENKLGKSDTASEEIVLLRKDEEKLLKLDNKINKEFSETEGKLKKINSVTGLKRQKEFAKTYEEKIAKLKGGLKGIVVSQSPIRNPQFKDKVHKLNNFIATLIPKEKHQPLGSNLPHRNVDYQAGEPVLGASIAPAYMATAPNLAPATLPRTPTPDDLAATIDTSQTAAIKDLADSLDKDPIKMYEFVRNNIIYEPYYGSRKGAQETLWEKGGNDIDQANLLIALYRYADIPTRYVTGIVEVPIDKAMNWVGVEKEEVAAKVFSSAGIPSKAIVSGGRISAIQIEHTWTEAYVNYDNYRGIDLGGEKMWVPLDPSFKQYEYKRPLDVKEIAGIDVNDFMTTDTAVLQQRLNEATMTISNYIAENMPGAKLGDVIGDKKIVKEELGLLPNSMPVGINPVSVTSERNKLIDSQRYTLSLKTDGLDYRASLPELAGKRITIYYSPATQADADLITLYGSLYQVPAYLMKVKPVVLVDGEAKISGDPITLGEDQYLNITINNQTRSDSAVKTLTAGAYYSVGLDYGKISSELIKLRKERLNDNIRLLQASEDAQVDSDELTGELLNLTSSLYFAQVDTFSDILSNFSGTVSYKEPSVAIPSYAVKTTYLFGTPSSVSFSGLDFDLITNPYIVQAKDGNNTKKKSWTVATGYLSSGAEHAIFNELYKAEAVSTVKILSLASEQNIPIHQITKDNIDTELALIQANADIKEQIRDSVNQGRVITIPERPITYHSWTGQGWVDMDALTGDAAYLIQGGIAGGAAVEIGKDILIGVEALASFLGLQIVRSDFTNKAGNKDFRYRFTATGRIAGTVIGQALEVITLIILPLVQAIFQFLEDMHNHDLTLTQQLQRAGAVFVVLATLALSVSVLVGNPIIAMITSIIISNFIWPMISKTVLDYYFRPTAMLRKKVFNYA